MDFEKQKGKKLQLELELTNTGMKGYPKGRKWPFRRLPESSGSRSRRAPPSGEAEAGEAD
jgi:hypothetical protein